MRQIFFFLLAAVFLSSCESNTFDRDKRQIRAKNAIREKLRGAKNFDIVAFREDTVASYPDTLVNRPLRYTLDFVYTDSTGTVQNKTGDVLFTPDGRSLLTTQIKNSAQ